MKKRTTVIRPAPEEGWEVWSADGRGGSWRKTGEVEQPSAAEVDGGSAVVGLPHRLCATVAIRLPGQPAEALIRPMVRSQLEKRGLIRRGAEAATRFSVEPVNAVNGSTLVSADVVAFGEEEGLVVRRARRYEAGVRLFDFPEDGAVLVAEQGRWVLVVARDGDVVHAHGLTAIGRDGPMLAAQVRLGMLGAEAEGLVDGMHRLRVLGPLSPGDAVILEEAIGMPVEVADLPPPSPARALVPGAVDLLPDEVRRAHRARRASILRLLVLVGALAVYGMAVWKMRGELLALEAQAKELEGEVAATSGPAERVKAAGTRWNSLRMVLEAKRYPMVHLAHLTRVMPEGGVVLDLFESKVSEVTVRGTARGAREAYAYFNAVAADPELKVYGWSMAQPTLERDGSANFEIKGKMR